MKRGFLILLFLSQNVFAVSAIRLSKDKGESHFLALGNPSALRIDGKGEGPEGELKVTENDGKLLIAGTLRVNLKTYETGISLRDRHMKEKYLEVDRFQNAVLNVQDLSVPKSALLNETETKRTFDGVLDFHGVQKKVQGEFTLKSSSKESLYLAADFKIKLSEFGVLTPSFAGITVADQVTVSVTANPEKVQ